MPTADMRSINGRAVLLVIFLLLAPQRSFADQIRVATASNFRDAMSAIAAAFETQSEHEVSLIFGSSGKHYAQIMNGAPFDAFFSADAERPALLENEAVAVSGSRFTYAIGKLVLWSPRAAYVTSDPAVLERGDFRHLAIANPDLAPYGRAAREALISLGLWQRLGNRLVRGENIGQTFQFVHSGNAELGLVAWSQLKGSPPNGSYWLVPQSLYQAIEQQAVLLKDSTATRSFMSYILGEEAGKIILSHGYDRPENSPP